MGLGAQSKSSAPLHIAQWAAATLDYILWPLPKGLSLYCPWELPTPGVAGLFSEAVAISSSPGLVPRALSPARGPAACPSWVSSFL